jgi:hypothetical protein
MKLIADRWFISEKEFYQLSNEFVRLSQRRLSMMIVAKVLSFRGAIPKDGGTSSTLLDKWNRSFNFDEAPRSDSNKENANPQ